MDGIFPPRLIPAPGAFVDATAVAALIQDDGGRFLLQLRDDLPHLPLPGHWALFAGSVEPDETPDDAILREIEEELSWRPEAAHWFTESVQSLPRPDRRIVRRVWYRVALPQSRLLHLKQREGADMRLFTLDEMVRLDRISPWDLSAALLLARHQSLFPG